MLVALEGSALASPTKSTGEVLKLRSCGSDSLAALKLIELYEDASNLTGSTVASMAIAIPVAELEETAGEGASICSKHQASFS